LSIGAWGEAWGEVWAEAGESAAAAVERTKNKRAITTRILFISASMNSLQGNMVERRKIWRKKISRLRVLRLICITNGFLQ
jgi:hypothetical protein